MKKLFLLFTMLIALFSGLWSQTGAVEEIDPDTLQFVLIPAVRHDVTVIISDLFDMILFTDEITVPKSALRTGESRSYFVNKDMNMEFFRINGVDQSLKLTRHIKAHQFSPRLRLQSLIEVSELSQMYSFIVPDITEFDDMVTIQIKYNLPLTDTLKYVILGDDFLKLIGCNFWYPRHLTQDEDVNLTIHTPPNRIVMVNNMELGFDLQSGMRVHRLRFRDKYREPADIKFITKR